MWWQDLLWGFWNGLTAWIVLIVHVFGGWREAALYNASIGGNWYDFGFLLGAGSPLLGKGFSLAAARNDLLLPALARQQSTLRDDLDGRRG